jgi:1-acyl-sn-glycerol-3-phosphate acyltransferase
MSKILLYSKLIAGFSFFGLCAAFFSLLLPFIWLFCCFQSAWVHRVSQKVIQHYFYFLLKYLRFIGVIDVNFKNLSTDKATRLIVCNHISLFDVLIILAHFPHCHTFVKLKFAAHPLIRLIVYSCGFIPVDESNLEQGAQAFERARKLLKEGKTLVVFPEGTRSKTGRLGRFHKGIFKLALETGEPLTPVLFTSKGPLFNNQPLHKATFAQCVEFKAYWLPRIEVAKVQSESLAEIKKLARETHDFFINILNSDLTFEWNKVKTTLDYLNTPVEILCKAENKIEASLLLLETHPHFEGHFEGFPVFPAVSQINLVNRILGSVLKKSTLVTQVDKTKFMELLRPQSHVTILIEYENALAKWQFLTENRIISKGQLAYATA